MNFFLAQTASETLAILGIIVILFAIPVACYLIHTANSLFTEKITTNYQSFINTNLSNSDSIFLEVYNDPTIGLKDKTLFLPYMQCITFSDHFFTVDLRYH